MAKEKGSTLEWFRLITPLSIAAAATVFWFQFTHMSQSFDVMSNNVANLSSDMSSVKANVENIDQRLLRDESMIDNKK